MDRNTILKWALQVDIIPWTKHEWANNQFVPTEEGLEGDIACLMQFAALVAEHEREACAELCEDLFLSDGNWCAKAIRSRKCQ